MFTGSICGTTLTVDSMTSGYVAGGQLLAAAGVNPLTRVYANLTLATDARERFEHLRMDNPDDIDIAQLIPGGVGTYQLGIEFVSVEALFTGTAPAASFRATATYGTMTVTQILSGTLAVGQVISGGVLPAGTIFQSQLSGAAGDVGQYLLGLPQTVSSRAMQGKGTSWTNMLSILNAIVPGAGCFPTKPGPTVDFLGRLHARRIGRQHARRQGSGSDRHAGPVRRAEPQSGAAEALSRVCPRRSPTRRFNDSTDGAQSFCPKNAPGVGGPYSGRVYASGPCHPYQFNGTDNIHTGDYGTTRWGEIEGYARWLVQDKGVHGRRCGAR